MRACCGVACWLLIGSLGFGQDWAKKMFDHTEHDFGAVARGAQAEHRFTFKNIWVEDVSVLAVTSSCHCTVPRATKRVIKTGQTADIVAVLDTRNFSGHREAAVKVQFDQPFPAEVILHVKGQIRGDVVVQPGEIDFGSIAQGLSVDRRVRISYAGRSDWQIVGLESTYTYLLAEMAETMRSGGNVSYDMTIRLRDTAPVGYINDQLYLITNDLNPREARVPVKVTGAVVPSISVKPSPLLMGVVSAGHSATKVLVVQSQIPFKIESIECGDKRFHFQTPKASQAVQVVPVTFEADDTTGNINEKVKLKTTAGGGTVLEVALQASVVPASDSEAPATTEKGKSSPATAQEKPAPGPSGREAPVETATPKVKPFSTTEREPGGKDKSAVIIEKEKPKAIPEKEPTTIGPVVPVPPPPTKGKSTSQPAASQSPKIDFP